MVCQEREKERERIFNRTRVDRKGFFLFLS